VVSIALVSFFGLQFKVFEEIVPVEKIEVLNSYTYNGQSYPKFKTETNPETEEIVEVPYFIIEPNVNGERVFQIECRVHPDNATNKQVMYSIDETAVGVSVSEDGLVRFEKSGGATVYITPADGSDFKTKIIIIAK
jgi:hypothetical protein